MGSRITITPHLSHVMGTVEGETCCTACFAAPWMAISEQECGSEGRTHRDNEARDASIAALYNEGMKLRDIRVAVGASTDTIHKVVSARCVRRRAGRPKLEPITPEQVATAQRRQAAGDRLEDVARDLGVDYKRLLRKLRDTLVAEQRRQT